MDDNLKEDNSVTTPRAVPSSTVSRTNSLAIPIAIIIGFGLIAAAIFFSGQKSTPENVQVNIPSNDGKEVAAKGPLRPVDENDHIRGNPNAPIVIVEYSDFDCPYCKNFHETMQKVMDNYGADGNVAWVYRQYPIEQLHPSAPRIAQASECVAELAGNDAFWKFTDLIFGERETNEMTNMSRLTEFATSAGASENAFEACMEDGRTKEAVQEDFADGINAGAKGTPYSLVLVGGQQGVINGAQPYDYVRSVLDTLIAQLEGKKN